MKTILPTLFRVVACLFILGNKHPVPVAIRGEKGGPMAARITELVNAVLEAEEGAPPLRREAVLDLIDLGGSKGGSEVLSPPALL